ncbi:prepilin-type N-terminal cleavage/methylation domain-containing protein [Clostridium algoriphilum]|uniref:prepilin-type N-terminal cleavage/methylation domain-containing protein n=1 Tax=Clostridium algoriphilum TaxID=198347 RepID=UPI001CF5CC8A|nr:prepilin-type N-terminal cleavage/methylation domain-containing protein [Clostridium algoriphilum]MCB2295208.1 prepilin-type N-terminal cleavage/methylation domain-containing protein [Clostridium algoriphilum]
MSKYKNYLQNEKGFTLIELIISIAILAIVTTAFLTMFTSGIVGISNSGKKSFDHYTAQSQIESNINDLEDLPSNVTTTAPGTSNISLIFPGSPNIFVISGRQIDVRYTYGRITKILTTFITN